MYEFSNSVRSQEKKYANSVLLRPFYEDSFRVFIISLIPKLPICHLYLGSLFGWILYLSVPESVYYLSTKYGLEHFFSLFNFRIELVLKNMHFFSCLKSLLIARLKLNNTGHWFGVFLFGENFVVKKFFLAKLPC